MPESVTYMCQVVVLKDEDTEEFCSNLAVTEIGIQDDENNISVLYVCDSHEKLLDDGQALVFASGDDRLVIEFTQGEIDNATTEPTSP